MINRTRELSIKPNGCIALVLPEDAALLPPEWNGRYPRKDNKKLLARLSGCQNHRCAYCSKSTWSPVFEETGPNIRRATIEHLVPRGNGGTDNRMNVIMACMGCNSTRGQKNPGLFFYKKNATMKLKLEPLT